MQSSTDAAFPAIVQQIGQSATDTSASGPRAVLPYPR